MVAKSKYFIHSPFVYRFVKDILPDNNHYYAFQDIELLVKSLKKNDVQIRIEDFGAGSKKHSDNKRSISEIVKSSAIPKKYGRLLFRLVNQYQPNTIIELGTSLGISTAYLASAKSSSRVFSIEGDPQIAKFATLNLAKLKLYNVEVVNDNFDDCLPTILNSINQIDLAFIDGNHKEKPTLKYFEQLLIKSHPGTILIFDDIYWSSEMENCWKKICKHPKVTLSIDLFRLGIIFLKPELPRQNYKLLF